MVLHPEFGVFDICRLQSAVCSLQMSHTTQNWHGTVLISNYFCFRVSYCIGLNVFFRMEVCRKRLIHRTKKQANKSTFGAPFPILAFSDFTLSFYETFTKNRTKVYKESAEPLHCSLNGVFQSSSCRTSELITLISSQSA